MDTSYINRLSDIDFYLRPDVTFRPHIGAAPPPMSRPANEDIEIESIKKANQRFMNCESTYLSHTVDWIQRLISTISIENRRNFLGDQLWQLYPLVNQKPWTLESRRQALMRLHYLVYHTFREIRARRARLHVLDNESAGIFRRPVTQKQMKDFRANVVAFSTVLNRQTRYVQGQWEPLIKLHMNLDFRDLAKSNGYSTSSS